MIQVKTSSHYNTVIVGGGIVGAGLFRDLALHHISTLIIEKGDFSSQTSERSSKMLHGGIRYLENFDFALVFEALHEKNLWLKLTPHLATEVAFYLPVYKDAKRPLWMIQLGMFLYDLLSSFENSPYKMLKAQAVLEDIPNLNESHLSGAGVYFDGVMDDAKITLEVLYDALIEKNANALSYTEVTNVYKKGHLNVIECKNLLSDQIFETTCENLIFALGPFTDKFLKKIPMYNWSDVLLPSKGSHLWISTKDLPLNHPIVITTKDDRVIFVIPHQDKILIGTTEVQYNGDFFDVHPSEAEIDYLLKAINDYFPKLLINRSHILSSFAGIRPLVKENDGADRGKTSREHKIFQPFSDTYVIAGGKYTTFRVMGQSITQEICHKQGKSYNPDLTKSLLRQRSVILPFQWILPTDQQLVEICKTEVPKTFDDLILRRLSIASRKIWAEKTQIDFNNHFLSKINLLKHYIHIDESDILSFK